MIQIDWNVLARQVALIVVPLIIAKLKIPEALAGALSGPLVELVASLIVIAGTAIVGWVIWIGQRREQPDKKIEAVANLPEVDVVVVSDPKLAESQPANVVSNA